MEISGMGMIPGRKTGIASDAMKPRFTRTMRNILSQKSNSAFLMRKPIIVLSLVFGMGMKGQSACAGIAGRRPIACLAYFLVVFFALAFAAGFFAGVFFAVVLAGIFPPLYDVLYPFLNFCQEGNLNLLENISNTHPEIFYLYKWQYVSK